MLRWALGVVLPVGWLLCFVLWWAGWAVAGLWWLTLLALCWLPAAVGLLLGFGGSLVWCSLGWVWWWVWSWLSLWSAWLVFGVAPARRGLAGSLRAWLRVLVSPRVLLGWACSGVVWARRWPRVGASLRLLWLSSGFGVSVVWLLGRVCRRGLSRGVPFVALWALVVLLVLLLWLALCFLAHLVGPLLAFWLWEFRLGVALAWFVAFSFFVGSGLVWVRCGLLLFGRGLRFPLFGWFSLRFAGAVGVALVRGSVLLVVGFFVVGLGVLVVGLVIHPLVGAAVVVRDFAFFSVMAEVVFGLVSFFCPVALRASLFVLDVAGVGLAWLALFWFLSVSFLVVGVLRRMLLVAALAVRAVEVAGALGA
ncbi:hypothetical protein SAMN04487939_103250 [Lysobacter sp. yr284]|nr:hypothetical protein SAMN04487939_103250 [Lysobacter sp. yr284]